MVGPPHSWAGGGGAAAGAEVVVGDRNEGSFVQLASMIDKAMTTGRKRPGFAEILTVATHSHQRAA